MFLIKIYDEQYFGSGKKRAITHKQCTKLYSKAKKELANDVFASFSFMRQTGLEPVRRKTHAPQTCLSASSSTAAYILLM